MQMERKELAETILMILNWNIWPMVYTNIFNPYSEGIDFSRQNLTSVDVRFWRLKSIPAL